MERCVQRVDGTSGYTNFRTAVGKLIFMALWRLDTHFAIQQLSTQVLNPTTESKRAQYLSSSRTNMTVQKSFCLNLLVVVTQIGPEIRQRAKRYGISWQRTRSDDVQPKSGTDSNQSQFVRSRVLRSVVQAQGNFWVSQNSSRNFTATFQFVSRWIQIPHVTFHSEEDHADSSTLKFDVRVATVDQRKKSLSMGRVNTKDKHCRSLHERSGWTENSFARKETWISNRGRHEWPMTTESLWTALPVEQAYKYSQFQQLTECTPRRHGPLYQLYNTQ